METVQAHPYGVRGVHRRTVLQAALATGVTLSTWALPMSSSLWGAEDGQPKHGGILRVPGRDPQHFDPHLTFNVRTHTTWLVIDDPSTGLVMYRTGQLDCGPQPNWSVRQPDLESLKQSHPHVRDRDFLFTRSEPIYLRTDQPPFNDVRVRRAISQAIDRQALIEAVWVRGEPTAAVPRGLQEWSRPIDQLGAGAKY